DDGAVFVGAGSLATAILGDSIATNLFVVGYAWQKGLVPLRRAAIERAIELNGVAVDFNKQAFLWGRRAAHDLAAVQRAAMPERQAEETAPASLDDIIARRMGELTAYQDAAYAKRYSTLVGRVRDAETKSAKGLSGLAEAVARSYFKLLAYKDEYEVARLHSNGSFMKQVHERFEGDFKLTFHLAPPLVASRNAESAELQKRVYESWMMGVFKVLARLKGLRGTPFDVFGYGAERRMERRLIGEYEATVEEILGNLGPDTHGVAVDIAALPETMRGFGHVKERNVAAAKASEAELFDAFRNPERRATAAE
ncbi:MAG: indolepyruvate ferredoxin oxidoreductase family protein, partial [Rhodospirillales bacterium]|nr:indolepyruvate ferredoxin oxidoreductase family protein [Rhodospirillales bacterium]